MTFYILFIFAVILLLGNYKIYGRPKPLFFTYMGVLFIIYISIFRFDVGWDYPAYYNMIHPSLDTSKVERLEPLNQIIFFIADYYKWPPLIFVIYGLITYTLVFNTFSKYSNSFFIASLTYLAFFYSTSLGPIRQGAALAVILFSYRYIVSKSYIKYIIGCIVACLFHYSAIISFVIPFLIRYMTYKKFITLLIVIASCYQILIYELADILQYSHYLNQDIEFNGGNLIRFVYIFIILSILLCHPKNWDKNNKGLLYMSILGSLFPFILGGHLGGRISWYFLIHLCILIPNILSLKRIRVRCFYSLALVAYFILFIYITTLNPIKQPLTPYKHIFFINTEHPIFK